MGPFLQQFPFPSLLQTLIQKCQTWCPLSPPLSWPTCWRTLLRLTSSIFSRSTPLGGWGESQIDPITSIYPRSLSSQSMICTSQSSFLGSSVALLFPFFLPSWRTEDHVHGASVFLVAFFKERHLWICFSLSGLRSAKDIKSTSSWSAIIPGRSFPSLVPHLIGLRHRTTSSRGIHGQPFSKMVHLFPLPKFPRFSSSAVSQWTLYQKVDHNSSPDSVPCLVPQLASPLVTGHCFHCLIIWLITIGWFSEGFACKQSPRTSSMKGQLSVDSGGKDFKACWAHFLLNAYRIWMHPFEFQ